MAEILKIVANPDAAAPDLQNSKCENCAGLEVRGGLFGGTRYLCGHRMGEAIKAFGQYGRPTDNGIPQVARCDQHKEGRHYSRRRP